MTHDTDTDSFDTDIEPTVAERIERALEHGTVDRIIEIDDASNAGWLVPAGEQALVTTLDPNGNTKRFLVTIQEVTGR